MQQADALPAPATIGVETASAAGAGASALPPVVREMGRVDYETAWRAMQAYTAHRDGDSPDELWVLEHEPVYTLGVAGRPQHLPRAANGIPVIKTDRGGQITYHGPGQAVVYLLLDLRRRGLSVRPLVRLMEQAVIDWLGSRGVAAEGRADAPGVYVHDPIAHSRSGNLAKIAALGLRIRNGCCYHGLAFNACMDLAPFHDIDPCGYPGLAVTQARDLGIADDALSIGRGLAHRLLQRLA